MPVLNGFNATVEIRAYSVNGKRVPIVGLLAGTSEAECEMCKTVGMNGYLTKPFTKIALQNALSNLN
jgi:CheY-like chemotaxis protein